MNTRAAVLHEGARGFSVETVDLAPPREQEVLVRIAAAGVCHSDWNLVTGDTPHPKPVVAGHEGAGIVESLGPGVTDLNIGDHIALSWAPSCGHCPACQRGRPALCNTNHDPIWAGTLLDGTPRISCNGRPIYHYCGLACFAEQTVVPRASCVKVPRELPMNVAALLGCAVTTGIGAAVNTAKVSPGSTVLVAGVGGVGLSIIMGAKLAGAGRIIAVDRMPSRADAAITLGATESHTSIPQAPGVDYAFDTTGQPRVIEDCLAATRPGGTTILVGLPHTGRTIELNPASFVRQEKALLGSYYGSADPSREFPHLAQLFLDGRLPIDRLITHTYPLNRINDAYRDMLEGASLRGVIDFTLA